MSIIVKRLLEKLNENLPTGFNAKLGGSSVLKGLKLINRPAEDMDIIISHAFYPEDKDFELTKEAIQDLFPLHDLVSVGAATNYPQTSQENYKFNFKIYTEIFGLSEKVSSINFLVQKDPAVEDYYSGLTLHGVPCVDVATILSAKRHYNRPKDIADFHEMQQIMFFNGDLGSIK